jgi:hypothetical protein
MEHERTSLDGVARQRTLPSVDRPAVLSESLASLETTVADIWGKDEERGTSRPRGRPAGLIYALTGSRSGRPTERIRRWLHLFLCYVYRGLQHLRVVAIVGSQVAFGVGIGGRLERG